MVLDLTKIGVAEKADSRNDTIESWISSNQHPPDSLDEDIFTLSPMCAQQDTLRCATSAQFRSLASDELHFKTQAPSRFDASHWALLIPYRAPEYLEIARQRLATAIPGQPQRQPPAMHVNSTSQRYNTDSMIREEQPSVGDRPSCGSYAPLPSFVHEIIEQSPAPLAYASSVFEDDSYRDETFDDENSSTTPTSIFSYCSSSGCFEPPDSTDTKGFAYAFGRSYDWWPPDQLADTLFTQPTSIPKLAHHNSRARSLLTESGAVTKSDATRTFQIGASQYANLSSLEFNPNETCDCADGLLLSNNVQVPSMGVNERESPLSANRWEVGVQSSPLGESECNLSSYPPRTHSADRRLQAHNGIHSSSPNYLSARKPFGRHNPNPQRHTLPGRSSRKDEDLIRLRQAGISYKDIKAKGKFTEAESTLRGRFRTLTKDKDQRVRKPQWRTEDLRLLQQAVTRAILGGFDVISPRASISSPGKEGTTKASKIPWKQVSEYIASHGGSYHFGNATCRKKWDEMNDTVPKESELVDC